MRTTSKDIDDQAEMVRIIPELRSFATRFVRDRDEMDNLVQETLTRGLATIEELKPGTPMWAWMFTIMRNSFWAGTNKGAEPSVD
ncbi:sigma factor [Rhizobium deserti]|nr:sigma factor [Rhizobium deserti]